MQGIYRSLKLSGRGTGTFFVFLLAVLSVFLLASGAYADQICSDCHDTNQHSRCDADNCAACHGNPPVDAGGLIHPYGGEPNPVPSGSGAAGAHAKHATSSGYNYPCSACHYGGMNVSSGQMTGGTNNGNGMLQMGFSIPMPGGATLSGGTYNGAPGLTYPYEGTNGTTVSTAGTKTCSNIYCHSDGTYVSTGLVPPGGSSPSWETTSVPLSCDACHGYPPAYPNGLPKANSHQFPSHNVCQLCHFGITGDGVTITNAANHANGALNVQPDTSATFNGVPVNFSYSYDPGGGTCSSISCHNGTSWAWGSAFTADYCTVCHTEIVQSGGSRNHHSGACFDCHGNDAPDGRKPHDGVLPAGTEAACTVCHTHESTLRWPMGSIHCSDCHTQGGVKPTAGTAVCNTCHGGSGPGITLTQAQVNADLVNIHANNPTVDFSYSFDPNNSQIVHVTAMAACVGTCGSYDWNFNGEGSGSGASASYLFASGGSKTITLTVTDSVIMSSASVSKAINVREYDQPPTAAGDLSCPAGWTVSVTDSSTDDHPLLYVTVIWGDGSATNIAQGGTASHTYGKVGSYVVSSRAVDSIGQSSLATLGTCVTPVYSIGGVTRKSDTTVLGGVGLRLRNFNTVQSCLLSPAISAATSNATTGAYSFGNLMPGRYGICATKSGYTFANPAVDVTVGPNVARDISAN